MSEKLYFSVYKLVIFWSRENVFILTVKIPSVHLKYFQETDLKKKIIDFKTEWMTLLRVGQARCCIWPQGGDTLIDRHCSTAPGGGGCLGGGRGEADRGGYSLGMLTGPRQTSRFSYLQVLKEAHFVFYGGSPHRPPVSVNKCSCKFTQDF